MGTMEALQPTGPEERKPEFLLRISVDGMLAYLKIKPAYSGQNIRYDDAAGFLKQQGIVYGLQEDALRAFCEKKEFYSEVLCAKGQHPEDGKDGSIAYYFDTGRELRPKEREDGTVDFRDLDLVKNVKKGELLCTVVPPEPGTDGTDIYGKAVPFRAGKMPALPVGSNTAVSKDGLSLLSAADGCIEFLKSSINVNEVFLVRGDVDNSSGNLNVNGSVVIQGDVRDGFSVKAGKDISVHGMVEGALLEAGGSIELSRGMNGVGRGTLKAAGNITGKYFENAILVAGRDIYADTMMNCHACAQGAIVLQGHKASLLGGEYQAGLRIVGKNIGTAGGATTKIAIQSERLSSALSVDNDSDRLTAAGQKLAQAEQELSEYREHYSAHSSQIAAITRVSPERGKLMLKASIVTKNRLTEAVEQLKQQIQKLEAQKAGLADFCIIGHGIVYAGTKLTIGPFSANLQNDYSNTKFHANQNQIVAGPVLPSDFY